MSGKPFIQLDEEEFRSLYESGLNTRQIAARLDISPRTAARRLSFFGMVPRSQGGKPHLELRDKSWLYERYISKRLPTTAIADEIGASPQTVLTWLKKHGIEMRSREESLVGRKMPPHQIQKAAEWRKKNFVGAGNPNWKGGEISDYQRERTSYSAKQWSKDVRGRDGHKCIGCGAKGKLHAHHIKPWKEFPELRYDIENGVTLCPTCHQKAHDFCFPEWAIKMKAARVRDTQGVKI